MKGALTTAFQIVDYYGIESDVEASLDYSLQRLKAHGYLEEPPTCC